MDLIKINIKDFNIEKKHGYMSKSLHDPSIYCGFLPGYGTTLFFENKHFVVVDDNGNICKHS